MPPVPPVQPAPAVDRVAIRLPPFWPADPQLWFCQIENQFAIAGLTSDDTKFGYVAGNLDQKYAVEVRDILLDPPAANKYDRLKAQLIARLSPSQSQKTKQLLETEEMGDRKPSQFLRHLKSLAGPDIPDSVVRTLWLGRLPASVQPIMATQRNQELDEAADLADSVYEATSKNSLTPPRVTAMENMMDQLKRTVKQAVQQEVNSATRPGLRSTPHKKHPRPNQSDVCWYHTKFGRRARKCQAPCKYSENFQASRN